MASGSTCFCALVDHYTVVIFRQQHQSSSGFRLLWYLIFAPTSLAEVHVAPGYCHGVYQCCSTSDMTGSNVRGQVTHSGGRHPLRHTVSQVGDCMCEMSFWISKSGDLQKQHNTASLCADMCGKITRTNSLCVCHCGRGVFDSVRCRKVCDMYCC